MSPNLTNPLYHLSRRVIAQGCFLLDRGSVGTRLAPAEDVDTAVRKIVSANRVECCQRSSHTARAVVPVLLAEAATKQGRSFTPDATGGPGLSMRHLCFTGWPLTIDYDRQAPS